MYTTRHAEARKQQRNIPNMVVEELMANGRRSPAGHGCYKIYFDRDALRFVQSENPGIYKQRERLAACYAIVDKHDALITVGYRTKRVKR